MLPLMRYIMLAFLIAGTLSSDEVLPSIAEPAAAAEDQCIIIQ